MPLERLTDVADAIYFNTSKIYSSATVHALRFAGAAWAGKVSKFKSDWEEMHTSWTNTERALVFGLVSDILHLVPIDGSANLSPAVTFNETLLSEFPECSSFQSFAGSRLGSIQISSRNRGAAPHDGRAVDFVGWSDSEWETLARVWLLKNQSGLRPGESCALGIRAADKHLHLDKVGYGVFVELSRNPIVSRMKSAVAASEWEGYVAEIKQRYSVTEHRFDFTEHKPTGIGKIIIISSLVWFFLLREKK